MKFSDKFLLNQKIGLYDVTVEVICLVQHSGHCSNTENFENKDRASKLLRLKTNLMSSSNYLVMKSCFNGMIQLLRTMGKG